MANFLSNKIKDSFFALDIGSTAVRAVQLKGVDIPKNIMSYASVPIDPRIAESDSKQDLQSLKKTIEKLIKDAGISEKNVVAGIPTKKIFASVVDFPKLSGAELKKTVEYQLESHVPTSIDEVKVDWVPLGPSLVDEDKLEVLIVSVNKDFAEERMNLIDDLGLNTIAFEPDAIALTRSLVSSGYSGSSLLLDLGYLNTDLVITVGDKPRLIRSVPVGGQSFVKTVAQNLNLDANQAQQFVYKFGLSTDKAEGQIYKALENVVENLISEISKSIKFFSDRYSGAKLDRIVVTGGASALPGLPLYIANRTGIQVEIGNPWQNISYSPSQYNELIRLSSHYATALGLGLRAEE